MKSRLPTLILGVHDMPRSLAFYRDLLGLPCRVEGDRWSEFDLGGHTLALHIEEHADRASAQSVVTYALKSRNSTPPSHVSAPPTTRWKAPPRWMAWDALPCSAIPTESPLASRKAF